MIIVKYGVVRTVPVISFGEVRSAQRYRTSECYYEKNFSNYVGILKWMFDAMEEGSARNNGKFGPMQFPDGDNFRWAFAATAKSSPIVIHRVTNDKGIIFSDGVFTRGKTHCSRSMRDFFVQCLEQLNAEPNFVDD